MSNNRQSARISSQTSSKVIDASGSPYLDVSGHAMLWRIINFTVAAVLLYKAHVLAVSDPDWWLWVPAYNLGALMAGAIAVKPDVVDSYYWRYIASVIIVFGTNYLILTAWVVRDVAAAYVPDPTDLMEGKECGFLAFIIIWAVLCRMTGKNKSGIISAIRLLLFSAIFLCCVPVLAWSFCFYSSTQDMVPYCRGFFTTPDSD